MNYLGITGIKLLGVKLAVVLFCTGSILSGCEKSVTVSYRINNNVFFGAIIEKYKGGNMAVLQVGLNNFHEENSGEYLGQTAPFFYELYDSVKIVFSDQKTLTFLNAKDIFDGNGQLVESLPPRIDGINGIQEFPVSGVNNILAEDGWHIECDNRRKKKCEYSFEIIQLYHDLAK